MTETTRLVARDPVFFMLASANHFRSKENDSDRLDAPNLRFSYLKKQIRDHSWTIIRVALTEHLGVLDIANIVKLPKNDCSNHD